ncbi:MAG: hypothetical protein EAZ75_00710 [Flavobacteriia bacterium]|jgi:hypothetical protein|uniref:hypothetical protein n=1 Tax=Flavobacterium sp. TaxID=239 RepID=UPI0029768202|nr:MAG: hypothetical protein EAZ75_00710 [Flavobacteriia bacterium]
MNNNLEKLLFLEITWKQFGKLNESEYYKTIKELNEEESKLSVKLRNELHEICNHINVRFADRINVDSIHQYDEFVSPVSEIILKVSSDFNLTLKGEISQEFKNAMLKIFGKDYLDEFLKTIN